MYTKDAFVSVFQINSKSRMAESCELSLMITVNGCFSVLTVQIVTLLFTIYNSCDWQALGKSRRKTCILSTGYNYNITLVYINKYVQVKTSV